MYRNCTTGQSTGCVAGMDKVSVQVDDGIPSSEYSKWGQREVIQFLRMGQCKPAETQVDVCWAWCCMCIKGNGGCLAPYVLNRQPANHQHAKTSTSHIVGNPQNIAQGKMQLMRTFWTACSLSTKINTSVVSIVREFVQDLGSLKVCFSVTRTFTAGDVFLWQNVAHYELWCQYFVPLNQKSSRYAMVTVHSILTEEIHIIHF